MVSEAENQLNQCYSLLLERIDEPYTNHLRIFVAEIDLSPEIKAEIGSVSPIEIQSDSLFFEIRFELYVLYLCLNESHGFATSDPYIGQCFRRYKSSKLLDQVRDFANPYNIYGDGELKHFEIVTEDHVISVLSYLEPIITVHPVLPMESNIAFGG